MNDWVGGILRIQSAKAKGRRACQEAKDIIVRTAQKYIEEDDVIVVSSSVCGEDLLLSPLAKTIFPFCFEVKNQERLNVWAAIEQAQDHAEKEYPKYQPMVVFRRNGEPLRCIVDFNLFCEYVVKAHNAKLP